MMQEIIIKMAGCLLLALGLGFLFGWLIKSILAKTKFGERIEELELDLARSNELIAEADAETAHVKTQLTSAKGDLEARTKRTEELESHLNSYKSQLDALSHEKAQKEAETSSLKLALSQKEEELKTLEEVQNSYALLKDNHEKLNLEHSLHKQEVEKLSRMVDTYKESEARLKESEAKLKEDKSKQENKLKELELTANELSTKVDTYKNQEVQLRDEKASYEKAIKEATSSLEEKEGAISQKLADKMRELEQLQLENSTLSQKLNHTESELKKVSSITPSKTIETKETPTFDKAESLVQNDTQTIKNTHQAEEGGFMRFAKKTFKKIMESGDEINKKADNVIDEYKKQNR